MKTNLKLLIDSVEFISKSEENTKNIVKHINAGEFPKAVTYVTNIVTSTRASSIIKQLIVLSLTQEVCEVKEDETAKEVKAKVAHKTEPKTKTIDLAEELGIAEKVTSQEIDAYSPDLDWMKEGTQIMRDNENNIVKFYAQEYLEEYPELKDKMDDKGFISINLVVTK